MNKKESLKNILIIDDDQDFRTLLKSLLLKSFPDVEIHEYDPIEKGEPEEGFDWSMFDVLILDHYLCIHGLTGLDLFEKHQNKSDFPLTIMLTGAGNEELVIRAFKAGINDYIRKDKLSAAVLYEVINKAHGEYLERQNTQHELQAAENQIQEGRSKLEDEVAKVNSKLESIEEEKRLQQDAKEEIYRMSGEAVEQIQKERSELEEEAATVKAQLESIEKEKRLQQDAKEEIQRVRSEAEEQIQKERSEFEEEAATVKAQLESIEKEKHLQQDAKEVIQRVRSEAEEQIQKERSVLEEEAATVKAQLESIEKEKRLQQDARAEIQRMRSEAEKHQQIAEMAKAKDEIENVNKALKVAEAKLTISEKENQKLETKFKQQLDKDKVEKTVSVPKEIQSGDEVLDSTQLGAAMDLDELLDPEEEEEAQKQSDSEVKEKPVENDASDEVLDSTQLGAAMDLDELLDPDDET